MSSADVYRQMAFIAAPELRSCPEKVVKIVVETIRASAMLSQIDSRFDKQVILEQIKEADRILRAAVWPKKEG